MNTPEVVFGYRSAVSKSISILGKSDRYKISVLALIQIVLGFLDLIGVALIGMLGALAVNGVASRTPGSRIFEFFKVVGLENHSFQFQSAFIAIIASLLLIVKTIASFLLARKTTFYLTRKGAGISGLLLTKILNQPLISVNSNSNYNKLYSVSSGVNSIIVGILSAGVSLIADFSLLIILFAGLIYVDFVIAITSILIFGIIGFLLFFVMNKRAGILGLEQANLNINFNKDVIEVLGTYRENFVHDRRFHYSKKLTNDRYSLADYLAEFSLMPNISKYVLEVTVILTALVVSGIQFSIHDAAHAVAILSVFLAASTRISPAVLRIQQSLISIKNAIGVAKPTFMIIDELSEVPPLLESNQLPDFRYEGFLPNVIVEKIKLTYPGAEEPVIEDLSLKIEKGQSIAIVGASGAGKTSLIDTILGLHLPESGHVTISGRAPQEVIRNFPGAISYVPQDILIIEGTIKENIALGYPLESISEEKIWNAIKKSQLFDFVNSLPLKLDTFLGERGTNISGGQRQRIGIARALYTNPKLLILDEATSSLDAITEFDITEAVNSMHGEVTVLTIAHRLATVRKSDQVIYMENGKILASGTFNEIRSQIPNFDEQAKLMGL